MTEIQAYNRREIIKAGRIPAEMMPKNAGQALKTLKTLPTEYYNSLKPRVLDDAICSIAPGLYKYLKSEGETKTRALMVIILSDLIEYFNVGKRMNDIQVAQTADLIIDNYFWFNIEDFKLCFNMAKAGKFGKVYDRIDGQVIMDWLATYEEMRIQQKVINGEKEHSSIKAAERNAPDFMTISTNRHG